MTDLPSPADLFVTEGPIVQNEPEGDAAGGPHPDEVADRVSEDVKHDGT